MTQKVAKWRALQLRFALQGPGFFRAEIRDFKVTGNGGVENGAKNYLSQISTPRKMSQSKRTRNESQDVN